MIAEARVSQLNGRAAGGGTYVLYWMQQSQRAAGNHALEYAVARGRQLGLPVLVGFGVMDDYPEANLRHYQFMLQGLAGTRRELRERGILMVVRRGDPAKIAIDLARDAALVVCDRGYLIHQRRWRDEVADAVEVGVVQVESDVVVPVQEASDKAEFAARTIRPKIQKLLKHYLVPLEAEPKGLSSLGLKVASDIDMDDIPATLRGLRLDRSVGGSSHFAGGTFEARKLLRQFVANKLDGYSSGRSGPADQVVSHMSPYLHFGQISPLEIALEVLNAPVARPDKEAFLEQLIVRRELCCNYVLHTPKYWTYEALPGWAKRTLERHASDPRPVTYTRGQLEEANTRDRYWNAAMKEMVHTGFMHNYMRMYWGKKVLEWKQDPREAFEDLLYLDNRYFIDGRDVNSYVGVAWCFGLHDRPWTERKIFGQVRYMNAAGLERKFDMDAYIRFVEMAFAR